MTPAARFWRRVYAIARKEALHVRRDARSLVLGFVMPIALLILMGAGVSFDLDRTPIVLVDQDGTSASRAWAQRFTADATFVVTQTTATIDDAQAAFERSEALAALVIPAGFGATRDRGEPVTLQWLVDGVEGNTAQLVLARGEGLVSGLTVDRRARPGVLVTTFTRYNPSGRSAPYIVPGLAAFVLALGAVLLTALTVSREWERGSMEQLFATPVGRLEIVLGKLAPYLAMGCVQFVLVLTAGAWLFDVPLAGSPWVLGVAALLFLLGMLAQGLLISVVAKNQMVATQMASLSTLLPALMLSGFLLPVENMPRPIQIIASLMPARHMVTVLRGVLLKQNGFAQVWPDLGAMAAFAFVLIALSTRRFERRLA